MIKPTIRLAQDSEAEQIREILDHWGMVPQGIEWDAVWPSWLVAEHRGEIVGCIQVLIGKPLGHIGFWAVKPEVQHFGFGIFLWKSAEQLLANSNCDGFTGLTDYKPVLKHLEKVGGVIFGNPVNWIFKRVYRSRKDANENIQRSRH